VLFPWLEIFLQCLIAVPVGVLAQFLVLAWPKTHVCSRQSQLLGLVAEEHLQSHSGADFGSQTQIVGAATEWGPTHLCFSVQGDRVRALYFSTLN